MGFVKVLSKITFIMINLSKATASWNIVHRHFLVIMWACGVC